MARLLAVLLAPLTIAGCGPVQSSAYLIDARATLEAAKTAGAEQYAPYEYNAASLYLHKAREEAGHSQYEEAIEYGHKALRFAEDARSRALAAPKSGRAR